MTPDLPPEAPPAIEERVSIDVAASLAAWAQVECGAERVEVQWTGLDSDRLPSETDRLVWQGDPCRSRPRLRVAAVVDGLPGGRFTVQPSLRLWVNAPVAAVDIAPGQAIEVTDALVELSALTGSVVRTGIARTRIEAGRPITSSLVTVPPDGCSGCAVQLVYSRGNLLIATDGRLLEDAALGEPVRVVNDASHAVAVGVLTASGRVEISR